MKPPLPPRQQEALDASRVKIREKYKEEKQALYDQYQQDLKDHQTHMVEERQQLQDDIEEDYAEKRESLKEQQQAELPDAKTIEEKRAISKKYKKNYDCFP